LSKLDQANEILRLFGLPPHQQNDRSAYTLLALCGLREKDRWADIKTPLVRIVDIMDWMKNQYRKMYAPNSRETVRRQTIHQFEQARIVDKNPDDPKRPTNSGKTVYRLTDHATKVLRSYGTLKFAKALQTFIKAHGTLSGRYSRARTLNMVPVKLGDGRVIHLSPGDHNELQRRIVEEFAPRFIKKAIILYLGDTAKKHIVLDEKLLKSLGVAVTEHDKLPDVVLYTKKTNWVVLIEAVTTHGPVSPKRREELEHMFTRCRSSRVYVTAFLTFADFRKYAAEIVWESEVWIAEFPDHMIHYNGDKFLGPH
jgi:hypothetical protein